MKSMKFLQEGDPPIKKPIMIAAMQDMGNVGNIVINFINDSFRTKKFRTINPEQPSYVIDRGGYIEIPNENWEYRYADGLIVFGGGQGQPQGNDDLNAVCQDVIDIARRYSAKLIYTVGGFHTNKTISGSPKTYVTTTSVRLTSQMREFGVEMTSHKSMITGFNGLILGFAKLNGIHGIGMYGEIDEPGIPQYRAAISIIKTMEKLTYRKIGNPESLEMMARKIDKDFKG